MKYLPILIAITTFSCNEPAKTNQVSEPESGSLEQKKVCYTPGLGEFMSSIQVHHAKLWFAGKNQNWRLADFEIHEIMEAIEDIQIFTSDRAEVKSISMIKSPLDSITVAIQNKNLTQFESSFILVTNACNSCHLATDHGFNVVKIPDTPPLSNQEFKVQ